MNNLFLGLNRLALLGASGRAGFSVDSDAAKGCQNLINPTNPWEAEGGFLLLGEPLTGLDLRHQHQPLAVARQLARRDFGEAAVLHDLNLAAQYTGQALLLHQGRPVASGTPAGVLTPDVPTVRMPF